MQTTETSALLGGIAPALFALLGTLVGSGLTFLSGPYQERLKRDNEARAALLDVSDAIHRLAWNNKVGPLTPEDPLTVVASLVSSARQARKALIAAGIPYRVAATALDPIDRLAVRQGMRRVLETDPDDAQALVTYLLGLVDRSRVYRRSADALTRLKRMSELQRAGRDIEGGYEHQNAGFAPLVYHAPDQSGEKVR